MLLTLKTKKAIDIYRQLTDAKVPKIFEEAGDLFDIKQLSEKPFVVEIVKKKGMIKGMIQKQINLYRLVFVGLTHKMKLQNKRDFTIDGDE